MRKIILGLFALTALISLALAQQAAAPASVPAAAKTVAPVTAPAVVAAPANAEKTLAGVVKSVSLADAVKGTKSEIVVADEAGKTTNVLVKATTTLYDADAKAITLDKIATEAKVSVVYTTIAEGVDEAKSVKIVK